MLITRNRPIRRVTHHPVRRWAGRHQFVAGIAVVFGAGAIAVLADVVFGERASFLLETAIALVLSTILALASRALVGSSANPRLSRLNRRILLVMSVLPALGAAFAGLQGLYLAADTVLPFDRIDTTILDYRTGSGARFPSHARIVTEAGTFDLPYLNPSPSGATRGRHILVVTHFERLVMEVLPPSG